jgi:CheY-like chemotaxis protein
VAILLWTWEFRFLEFRGAKIQRDSKSPGKKMTESFSILVVDDNPSMALALRDVLEMKGIIAYAARSGQEALEILRAHPVDLLLTDVIMPEMNGLNLYRETKKTCPRLTTFFMTAYSADDLIQQGMREGIKTILNKPLDIDLLLLMCSALSRK